MSGRCITIVIASIAVLKVRPLDGMRANLNFIIRYSLFGWVAASSVAWGWLRP